MNTKSTDEILANVEAQRGIALLEYARAAEIADRFGQFGFVMMLRDQQATVVQQFRRAEDFKEAKVVFFVGRVEEDQIPRIRLILLQELRRLRTIDIPLLLRHATQLEIRFDQLTTPSRAIDKRRVRRASRERFNTNRA